MSFEKNEAANDAVHYPGFTARFLKKRKYSTGFLRLNRRRISGPYKELRFAIRSEYGERQIGIMEIVKADRDFHLEINAGFSAYVEASDLNEDSAILGALNAVETELHSHGQELKGFRIVELRNSIGNEITYRIADGAREQNMRVEDAQDAA